MRQSTRRSRMNREARVHTYQLIVGWGSGAHVCECQWMPGPDHVVVQSGRGVLWHRPQRTVFRHDLRLSDGYETQGVSYVAWCNQPLHPTTKAGPLRVVPASELDSDAVLCAKCDRNARQEGIPDLPIVMVGGGCAATDGQRWRPD